MSFLKCLKSIGVHEKLFRASVFSNSTLYRHVAESSNNFVETLKSKLQSSLKPEYLEVINESGGHNVPKGSASHIRVIIVSPLFDGKRLVQRHRLVNDVLQDELKGPIHALSIQAISPTEMKDEIEKQKSPPCRGGSKS